MKNASNKQEIKKSNNVKGIKEKLIKDKRVSFLDPIKEMQGGYGLLDTKTLKGHTFKYDEHEIFYRNDVPTVSSFYGWRIVLVVIGMLAFIFPGLLLLVALFGQRKPRDRCLLVSKEGIGKLDKPSSFSSKSYYFLEKENVGDIIINGDNISIKKKGKNSKYFSFSNIREIEKLKYSLKKHGYKFEN